MKEKSYVARLGVLALVLTLMTTYLTGGTLARLITEVEGTATATMATRNSGAAEGETGFTGIDTGGTTYKGDTIKDTVFVLGTRGLFGIVLDESGSEVGINYSVAVTAASDVDLPNDLILNIDDTTYDLEGDITGAINYIDEANAIKKTITINQERDCGSDDTVAHNDNDYAGKSWILDTKVTGTQVEPASTAA